MNRLNALVFLFVAAAAAACNNDNTTKTTQKMSTHSTEVVIKLPARSGFTDGIDGKPTDLYLLKNSKGVSLAVTNYGGRFVG